jgi:DNA-binding XRE family transcriptional regulator
MERSKMDTLRDYRKTWKLTQKQLADAVGVHVQCISNWERGGISIPRKHYKALCLALGVEEVHLDYLEFLRILEGRFGRHKTALVTRMYKEITYG